MVLKGFRSVFNKLERADVRPQHDGGDDSTSTGDVNVRNLHCSVVGTVRRETGFHTHPVGVGVVRRDGKIKISDAVIFQFARELNHIKICQIPRILNSSGW